MAELHFDRARIQAFLELAGERLQGKWLLIGGGAAATWFAPGRTTEDIDLIGLDGTQAERFALMDLALEASLPIEAVNSAADFFVRRVAGWRDHLVVIHTGSTATIYRPDPTLFLLLKINRLSESDLDDCVRLLAHCAQHGDAVDVRRAREAIVALPATDDADLSMRRSELIARLASA